MADFEFFKKEFEFKGKHAKMAQELWVRDDTERTYFKRLIDLYVECSIKAGTQGGSKIRLKGKGISSMKNPSVRGDQYVTVEISVPRRLTPRAKEALEEYRAVS